MIVARWRATLSLAMVSESVSSSTWKLERFIQPVAVVLSPMDNRQESGGMVFSMASTQMQIIDPKNSSRLICARPWRWEGKSHRHALPAAEYPPRPCSHASER